MTTTVEIRSPHRNHRAVRVAYDSGSTGGLIATLDHGQRVIAHVAEGGAPIVLTEVDIGEVGPPRAELSLAEKMAGVGFNPGQNPDVAACKDGFADCIQQMLMLREQTADPEVKRMASIAITELQTAQMWAVKAITWRG